MIVALIAVLSWIGLSIAIARTGESRAAVLLLNAFVGGVLVIGLGLQLAWRIGWNVRTGKPILLAAASAINLRRIARQLRRGSRPLVALRAEAAGFWALSATALLLSLVYINHAGPYYGRAWGDHLNAEPGPRSIATRNSSTLKRPRCCSIAAVQQCRTQALGSTNSSSITLRK